MTVGERAPKRPKLGYEGLNLEAMNETDVREIIVRPFLHALGYQYGTSAHIRTEVPLRYSKVFLGHKKPAKDPELRGRADYICEVVSYGRWVVEVKPPTADLSTEDAQQAHTYAAHPEIAALFYLLTNGREFRLYRTSKPDDPALTWSLAETNDKFPVISNAIGPDAIRRRSSADYIDTNKPLGPQLNSSAKIIGGIITYAAYSSRNPAISAQLNKLAGARAGATGKDVIRTKHGLIRAELELAGPYQMWDAFNRAAGIESYVFETANEYISNDPERPTIFQNISSAHISRGMHFAGFAGLPSFTIPFGMDMLAYTEAVGYLNKGDFCGTFSIEYVLKLEGNLSATPQLMAIRPLIENANMKTVGDFNLILRS